MYFAVVKLTFEPDTRSSEDWRDLHALALKLRVRFKVCAAAMADAGKEGTAAIAITALASNEERLSQTLDAISEFCETSFGRIASEQSLMDEVDAIGDFQEDESLSDE